MPDQSDAERIDFLYGQIHALTSFMLALIETHPNQALVRKHLEVVEQIGLAKVEGLPVSDSVLEGYRFVAERLLGRGASEPGI